MMTTTTANLAQSITKVLSNTQVQLVLTQNGFEVWPLNFKGSNLFIALADNYTLQKYLVGFANHLEAVDHITKHFIANLHQWILNARYNVFHLLGPYDDRIAFYDALLEKF